LARRKPSQDDKSRRRPATTPEARENELVSLAHDLAEEQIRAGHASSQVITHFLKLGSSREKLEQERIAHENQLLEAKREHMQSQARVEELYLEALQAMKSYSGSEPELEEDEPE
jgi:hypothetical protein